MQTQRHFRGQLVIAAGALFFAAWAHLSLVELAILVVTVALVLGAELLNSAVEQLTDLLHPERGPAAAVVKDMSAGAVLTTAALALTVGLMVFLPHLAWLPLPSTRGIPLVLGLLCLATLLVGAVRGRGAVRP